jgi:hypothetical protein
LANGAATCPSGRGFTPSVLVNEIRASCVKKFEAHGVATAT